MDRSQSLGSDSGHADRDSGAHYRARGTAPGSSGYRILRALRLGADFDRVAKGAGIRVLKMAVKAPLMNSTCERFIGSVRRECVDYVIVLGEVHLQHVLDEYCLRYFNRARAHQGLAQRVPVPSGDLSSADGATLIALPLLGGLHHEYRWAA